MYERQRCAISRAGMGMILILLVALARPAAAQLTLSDYSYPVSGWVNSFGPDVQGGNWAVRKALSDFIDYVTDTVDLASHPLLNPQLGPFISKFHHARWWESINTLSNVPIQGNDIRLLKLYSSSWIVQANDGAGRFTFAIDLCDGPFETTIYTPNNVPVDNAQIQAMANTLDAYFITHVHSDHLSARLILEMLIQGKPVIASQEVKNQALYMGAPNAASIIVPDGTTQQIGPLTWTSFSGWQYGSFLDAAQTVPNLSDPFNVTNNAFLFEINGRGIAHFGDNNDTGIVAFLQDALNNGWDVDFQLNLGQLQPTLEAMIAPQQRFLSHDLEFHHFGAAFLSLLVSNTGPNPNRRVLIWGEHLDLP